nr:hypothetical protein [Tanacetum cinerariifolium]
LDNLGKFEEKGDEGYFIGYSMSRKAFKVFNKRTRRVEKNLHVDFLENKAIEKGAGPNWLFDIDSLTKSMNYVPVDAGTISTNLSGTNDTASQEVKKYVSSLRYIALPNWAHDAIFEFFSSKPQDDCSTEVPEGSRNTNPTSSTLNPPADHMETLIVESPIPTVSLPIPTAYSTDSQDSSSDARLISKRVVNQKETPSLDNILTLTNRFEDILGEPKKIFDALQEPSWVEAMQEELFQFKIQKVWTLVDCPKGEEGIDYDEVFAPVARIKAISLFLAYALFMGFTVYQMDVKSAFLYGTIDEKVYVMHPPGFQDLKYPAKVYKVGKAMYGLHQAPRAWYGTLSKYLLKNGFQRGTIDQILFIIRQRGDFILVQVYVDDIIFGSSNPQLCREFEPLMHEKFQMSAMSELNFFLGLLSMTCETLSWEISTSIIRLCLTIDASLHTAKTFDLVWIWLGGDYGNGEHNIDFHPMVDFVEASPLRIETTEEGTKILATVDDEPASPLRDVSQREACLTESGFIADHDRTTIAKSSTRPHDSASRVTSPAAIEGKDGKGMAAEGSGDDAPIKGRRLDEEEVATKRVSSDTEEIRLDEGEVAVEKVSDDTEELATVLITMDAVSVLSSGRVQVVPTAAAGSPANVIKPYTRRKGKEKMVENHTPKKKKKRVKEQIDIQFAKELKEELEREAQRMNAQISRDEEIAKIHAEEELQQMIAGMSFEEVEAKFKIVWEQIEGGVFKISEGEAAWLKRKGIRSEQESAKKQKTIEEVPEELKSCDEIPEEKIKELIRLIPIEEVYVEALQVKYPIIDWKVHTEGQRSYWKITRLGGSSASYQFFVDMLKQIDREDLNQLWALVKETLSIRPATNEKEMELWVELKRLYEPDVEDHLWTHSQHIMHAFVDWRLYDTCGVHHVTFKDMEIFMLVEKNYPLRKALALVMICYKLEVENYSQMATDLVRKIQHIASTPSLQGIPTASYRVPLPEELPTAREERCHCWKKREATARRIALLSMSRRNCQSKMAVTLRTINLGLWYPKDFGFDLTAYSEADHAGCHLDRKSTSYSVQFLGDKLVCWSSKKQNYVSISTTKSEYVAVSSCCAQVLWMRTQLTDYGFFYDKDMGEPLRAKADDPMVDPMVDEVAEPIVEGEEQLVALLIDVEDVIAMLFGDDGFSDEDSEGFKDGQGVWEDLSTRMGNLEYGHGRLLNKVIQVSDAEVVDDIAIGEISLRVVAVEGQVQVMASQMVHALGRLEQVGTQVEQGQQAVTQRDKVIFGLSQQVQTLQADSLQDLVKELEFALHQLVKRVSLAQRFVGQLVFSILTPCVVMMPIDHALRFSFGGGIMRSTGIKRYIDPISSSKIWRTNYKRRIPIDLYPCKVEDRMTMKKVGDQTIGVIWRRRIDKEGNVSRFQEYHTSDEEEEEPSENPPYNKYGFVDHPQLQMEDQRNDFEPNTLSPQEGNMKGWLNDDANDSNLESTASNQPMSMTMEDTGGS